MFAAILIVILKDQFRELIKLRIGIRFEHHLFDERTLPGTVFWFGYNYFW